MTNNTDYMKVNIKTINEDTGEETEQTVHTRCNIFQPVLDKEGNELELKGIRLRLVQFLSRCINLLDVKTSRFWVLHKLLKPRLFYPAFKLLKFLTKNYVVTDTDDIHAGWYNNHIRIRHWALNEGLKDMWRIMHYLQCKRSGHKQVKDVTPEQHYENKKGNLPTVMRKLAFDLWITMMLEDTMDRELNNFAMLREWHEMAQLYGVSATEAGKVPLPGQYPIYLVKTKHNPEYFARYASLPVWQVPNGKVKEVKEENVKTDKQTKVNAKKDKKSNQKRKHKKS